VAHDVLLEWLPHCRSALVICDSGGGYRRFLAPTRERRAAEGGLWGTLRLLRVLCHLGDTGALLHELDTRSGGELLPRSE